MRYYRLVDRVPVGITATEWIGDVESIMDIENRRVEKGRCSTVFLSLEHPGGVFETLAPDGSIERCWTWNEAVRQHNRMEALWN